MRPLRILRPLDIVVGLHQRAEQNVCTFGLGLLYALDVSQQRVFVAVTMAAMQTRSVLQAFEALRATLELTEAQQADASRQQEVVRTRLRDHLGARHVHNFLTGSYKRRTAIGPLKDIDFFVVLRERTDWWDGSPVAKPAAVLQDVQKLLGAAYPSKEKPKIQTRSVNIAFTGTGISFDVVPAVAAAEGGYWIPDRDAEKWIRSHPEKHEELTQRANERAGGKLNQLVKLLKYWKRLHDVPLSSFHLEVMSCRVFTRFFRPDPPRDLPRGLALLFDKLGGAVQRPCSEPAGLGPKLDGRMSAKEREEAHRQLTEAARVAASAIRADEASRTSEAHTLWSTLFGGEYERAAPPM